MSQITAALYDRLAGDATLVGLLAPYGDDGAPGIFTTDPVPGDAARPYIVTAGDVVSNAWDTKLTIGREVWRDVRCYTDETGSAMAVEEIAERVRELLHRQPGEILVPGVGVFVAECSGPIVADEQDVYGRIVTVRLMMAACS